MQITDEMLYQCAPQAREIWLEVLPQQDEIPFFTCSNLFQRKMNRLLRQQRRSPQTNRVLHNMKRIVAVFLIAVTITFAGLMTVEAVRRKVVDFVVHIYHELTQYEYSSDKEAAALPELRFDYLPAGMELVADEAHADFGRYILWKSDSGQYLDLNCIAVSKYSAGKLIIDTEDAQVTTHIIKGREVTFVLKDGTYIIRWADEIAHYTIQSDLDLPELLAFIDGLSAQP